MYIDFTKAPTKSANSDIISDFISPPEGVLIIIF